MDGKRITGKISAHPAFSGVLAMKAKLYDYQVEHCEEFTFFSERTNSRVNFSYQQPKNNRRFKEKINCYAKVGKIKCRFTRSLT